MVPFERSLSKLSENHQIVDIGSTEIKLRQLNESEGVEENLVILLSVCAHRIIILMGKCSICVSTLFNMNCQRICYSICTAGGC